MAAETIEPRGESREDLRMGILGSIIANQWRGKNDQVITPKDIMPKFGELEEPPQTPQEAARLALRATIMMGGKVQ